MLATNPQLKYVLPGVNGPCREIPFYYSRGGNSAPPWPAAHTFCKPPLNVNVFVPVDYRIQPENGQRQAL